ncbi:MAG: DNA-protecting protein DprA [Verrucomicrobia bacterium]|nr:DNA-protecting protein DprA [Cytophagales bacterium]
MSEEKIYQLALTLTPGVGNFTARYLVSYCGSAKAVFETSKSKLLKIPNIGKVIAEAVLQKSTLQKAESQCLICEKNKVQLLFYTDTHYPERLKTIADAPVLLFYKGNAPLNTQKTVAVVGTRSASPYGKKVTEELVSSLAKFASLLVISGLAYGIDAVAHQTALKYSIPTLGVMATGMDTVYPSEHKNLAAQMLEKGGLLTEYLWGSKTDPSFFPARNRIIAGLADAVIVVEAARSGGALITAEIANTYLKDVFAVPGNINNKFSEGCNNLIKENKAHLVNRPEDIEYIMNWQWMEENKKITVKNDSKIWKNLPEEQQQVLHLLDKNKEMLFDELSWQSQIPVNKLAGLLLDLELQGLLSALPGKKFVINN